MSENEASAGPVAQAPPAAVSELWQEVRDFVLDQLAVRRAEITARLGMSFIKAKALRRLVAGPLTMGELTAELNTDAPYTSVVIDDLVTRKLAFRTTDLKDRRRRLVALTAAGLDSARTAQEILDRPPADFTALAALFDRAAAQQA